MRFLLLFYSLCVFICICPPALADSDQSDQNTAVGSQQPKSELDKSSLDQWHRVLETYANVKKIKHDQQFKPIDISAAKNCGCSFVLPGAKTVYAFLPFWESQSPQEIDFGMISRIAFFSLSPNKDGSITDFFNKKGRTNFIEKAHKYRCKVDLVINCYNWTKNCDPSKGFFIDNFVYHMTMIAKKYDFDGITLDFQNMPVDLLQYFNLIIYDLMKNVKGKIEKEDFKVNIVIPPYIANFETASTDTSLASLHKSIKFVDNVLVIMEFDKNIQRTLRSIAPINKEDSCYSAGVIDTLNKLIESGFDAEKIIPVLPLYGNGWLKAEDAEDYSLISMFNYGEYKEKIAKTCVSKNDFCVDEEQNLLYDNMDNLGKKIDVIFDYNNNFAGVGFWALGYQGKSSSLWDVLHNKFDNQNEILIDRNLLITTGMYSFISKYICPNRLIFKLIFLSMVCVLFIYFNLFVWNCYVRSRVFKYRLIWGCFEMIFILIIAALYYSLKLVDSSFEKSFYDEITGFFILYFLGYNLYHFILSQTKYKHLP